MKKVLSLVLVIAMVLSSMSFAFASTSFTDVVDGDDYEDAINTLVALNVVTGYEDGTYKPEKTVTRAEMAKLMVQLLGYGDLVAGSQSNFTDTQGHWADPWIALAAGKGIVIGTGDGKFDPERTVTYDEVLTMIVRGLGYTDDCNEIKGTWPSNFKVKAAELGITKNVKIDVAGADRGGVAQAMFNALEAKIVTVDNDKNVKDVVDGKGKTKELLSRIAELDENYVVSSDLFDPTNKNYAGDFVDLAPYMYQNLEVYLNDDDEVVYIKDSNSLVVEGEIDEVTISKNGKIATVAIETENGSIEKVDFTVDDAEKLEAELPANVFENRAVKSDATFKYVNDEVETIKIVANEGDKSNGKIEEDEVDGFVLETQTKVARVEEEYEDGDTKVDVFTLPENSKDEPDFNKIIVKGAVDSLEDIAIDDVVVEYLAEDDEFTTLVVTRDTVEGEITRIGGTDVYVDGTKYKLSTTSGAEDSLLLGDTGVFYLDHNGKIAAFDGEADGATDYVVVIGTAVGKIDKDGFKNSIDDYPRLKVITQSGDEVIYNVYVKLNSDGKITGSAKYEYATEEGNKVEDLFTGTPTDDITAVNFVKFEPTADPTNSDLEAEDYTVLKIKLNSSNEITRLEEVASGSVDLDTTKSSFKLADNALLFSVKDEEAVAENKLDTKVEGIAVRNKNGEIEVLLTEDVDGLNYKFAYITKVQEAKQNGDEVQALKAYLDGKLVDPLYTDEDSLVTDVKTVYALDIDDDGIVTDVVTPGAVSSDDLEMFKNKVATGVSNSSGTIEISGKGWLTLAEDATIVELDDAGDVDAIRKLSAIEKNESILDVYVYGGEVVLIVIKDSDYNETSDDETDEDVREVTYINSTFTKVVVDGTKTLTFDSDTAIYGEDGTIIAVGYEDIMGETEDERALVVGDKVKDIEIKDGVVVSLTKIVE
ncbi:MULTISPECIES: S-layer homology domain-containing protein [unclassified Sedimentibacter]|uniref:S-layer homology domain-containing protein n=1 Tax=unclassified Sedimentibacter TaxID=2649220 RepID=UPI0027DF5097|nr:S-layer homology domain-containing protein [Sedimentibacter sp. MB35-C1]WMJ78068.1 S-layer homology domain-containing protein [Sedimentibacter sp. MB35-C1]